MEQMQQFMPPEQISQADKINLIGNIMQMELAQRHGEELDDFVEKHAKEFRREVDAHPEYVEQFESDPDAVLAKLEEVIFH